VISSVKSSDEDLRASLKGRGGGVELKGQPLCNAICTQSGEGKRDSRLGDKKGYGTEAVEAF
jgi:hypothetical protein